MTEPTPEKPENQFDITIGQFLIEILANQSYLHQITAFIPPLIDRKHLLDMLLGRDTSRYNNSHFYGIIINISASKFSTTSYL